jgi:hypothetical protein
MVRSAATPRVSNHVDEADPGSSDPHLGLESVKKTNQVAPVGGVSAKDPGSYSLTLPAFSSATGRHQPAAA